MAFTIAEPNLEDGTRIYDVSDGVANKQPLGFGSNWSTRLRLPGRGGCPSWIDQIVIAKDLTTANKRPLRAPQPHPVASSSFSSRDVVAIFLDQDGKENERKVYSFVYIVDFEPSEKIDPATNKPIPIVNEMWFSLSAVDDPKVRDAESNCEGSPA